MAQSAYQHHEETFLSSVSDIFTASITYASQLVEQHLARCTKKELALLEQRFQTTEYRLLVNTLVKEAASAVGVELVGLRLTRSQPLEFHEPPTLVSFEDLIAELMSKVE